MQTKLLHPPNSLYRRSCCIEALMLKNTSWYPCSASCIWSTCRGHCIRMLGGSYIDSHRFPRLIHDYIKPFSLVYFKPVLLCLLLVIIITPIIHSGCEVATYSQPKLMKILKVYSLIILLLVSFVFFTSVWLCADSWLLCGSVDYVISDPATVSFEVNTNTLTWIVLYFDITIFWSSVNSLVLLY